MFRKKIHTGDWGPAVNLGATINTPFNEDTPFITENDSVFYFSSEGHNSMGGFDNFKSQKTGIMSGKLLQTLVFPLIQPMMINFSSQLIME